MTRFLSEALQAEQPFRAGLKDLEAANGRPSHDIRLSSEVMQATKAKLRQLGLDPNDTTPKELYGALQQRVKADDRRLVKTLRTTAATHISAEADVTSGMVKTLKDIQDSKRCFAIKQSSLRNLIKNNPPKKAVKRLGYRSFESCLKHESPLNIMAAAWLAEGSSWQTRLLNSYKQLQPADFEDRQIVIVKAEFKGWQNLAEEVVEQKRHNLLSFKELGALVLLPLPKDTPDGVVTSSLSLALHELNEIRASSTFLKLYQVRPDFGTAVRQIALSEPTLNSRLLDKPVAWNLLHRYYARLADNLHEAVFEPHLSLDDIDWHPIEQTLSKIEPSLDFWHNSSHLGLLHKNQPVSLNIVDAALNCCNNLSFEERTAQYFQRSLWHELLLRYLKHEPVEKNVLTELQPALALEPAVR